MIFSIHPLADVAWHLVQTKKNTLLLKREKSSTSVGFFKGDEERKREVEEGKMKLNFASIFPSIYIVCVFIELKKKSHAAVFRSQFSPSSATAVKAVISISLRWNAQYF
jgi:hypothetical protein